MAAGGVGMRAFLARTSSGFGNCCPGRTEGSCWVPMATDRSSESAAACPVERRRGTCVVRAAVLPQPGSRLVKAPEAGYGLLDVLTSTSKLC